MLVTVEVSADSVELLIIEADDAAEVVVDRGELLMTEADDMA